MDKLSESTETIEDVLCQAESLLARHDAVVAAAVLAGGALETHLRHLCERWAIDWLGKGSISADAGKICSRSPVISASG